MTEFETIQIVIGVLQIAATALIAVAVAVQAERLKRAEITSNVESAYNLLNSIALSNPEVLRTVDSLGRPETSDTDETRRKRWCAFVWLVALQETYISRLHGLIDRRYAVRALRQQLEIILKDDLVFWLVLNRGFHPDFVRLCRSIRKEIVPDKPLIYTETEAIAGVSPAI